MAAKRVKVRRATAKIPPSRIFPSREQALAALADAVGDYYTHHHRSHGAQILAAVALALVRGETFDGAPTRRLREWARTQLVSTSSLGRMARVMPYVDVPAALRSLHRAVSERPGDSEFVLVNLCFMRIVDGPVFPLEPALVGKLNAYRRRPRVTRRDGSEDAELILVYALKLCGWSDRKARRALRNALGDDS